MKKLVLGVVAGSLMMASVSLAGEACRLAAEFNYTSVAQNTACIVEFLWELGWLV